MSGFEDEKQTIRKQLLAKRLEHSKPEDFSLFALELLEKTSGLVASYWSTDAEPETKKINDYLASRDRLVLPAISGPNLIWKKPEKLIPSSFGIMAPVGEIVAVDQLELVLAPALAVSKNGTRLGKGGGYFDRALSGFKGDVYPLVFESEFVDYLPREAHDKSVQGVITEKGLRVF